MKAHVSCGVLLSLFAMACGGSALPPPKVTETQAAIAAAEAVGAQQQPRGALHLKLARDQMQQAQALIRDGETETASMVLDRARIDAELALVLTRSVQARSEAQAALQKVNQLNQEQR